MCEKVRGANNIVCPLSHCMCHVCPHGSAVDGHQLTLPDHRYGAKCLFTPQLLLVHSVHIQG